MKIKMKTLWQHPEFSYRIGDIVDVEETLGRYLIKARNAELIESEMIQPIENAMLKKPVSRPVKRR